MMLRPHFAACLLFFAASFACMSACADVINYGDRMGDNVWFRDIFESSANDELPLFGEPVVNGDSLDFPGVGFVAEAIDSQVDFVDGRLQFTIEAKNGFLFDKVSVREFGAYFLKGDDVEVLAHAIAFVVVDGNVYDANFVYQNDVESQGGWLETLSIMFPATNSATFVMDNQLFASAGPGDVAFIDKKGITITVDSFEIPEPSAGLLLGIGMVGIALVRRRR